MSARVTTHEFEPTTPDVLVVDDDAELRLGLVDLLEQSDLVAVGASNGEEALALAGRCLPRLILLDMNMPVLDGWQFLQKRDADEALRRVPVVIISAAPGDQLPRGGVEGLLSKPLDEGALLATIDDLLAGPGPAPARRLASGQRR
jgi:CheY-like chemotaxis protein